MRRRLATIGPAVRVVRTARKVRRAIRTRYLRWRHAEGGYLVCGPVRVFCDFTDPSYAWYDGFSANLALDCRVIDRLLEQTAGNVLMDIGAHCGFFTAYLARPRPGHPRRRVIAVEPDPRHLRCLAQTIGSLPGSDVTVFAGAIAAQDGTVPLYRTTESCLHTYPSDSATVAGAVVTRSLDSLVSELLAAEDRIALIKIDVDGAEAAVLAGGRETVRRHRPVLLMEFAPTQLRHAETDVQAFFNELCAENYVYWISYRSGTIQRVGAEAYASMAESIGDGIADLVVSSRLVDLTGLAADR